MNHLIVKFPATRSLWRFALALLATSACSFALGVDDGASSVASVRQLSHGSRPRTSRHAGGEMPESAKQMYSLMWGVADLSVRIAESGQLVRFSYRVTDARKAAAISEKTSAPYLLDEQIHAVLQVPTMEKVGPLRQSQSPESGKSYWMVFSNKGGHVKVGHRVSVFVGPMRLDGLVVQE